MLQLNSGRIYLAHEQAIGPDPAISLRNQSQLALEVFIQAAMKLVEADEVALVSSDEKLATRTRLRELHGSLL